MVVKTDEKELRVRKGKKGWAGWIPKSEDDSLKFQRWTLCLGRSTRKARREFDARATPSQRLDLFRDQL